MRLGLRVEAAGEVGRVRLEVTGATDGVGVVVLVYAAGREDGDMDAREEAGVGQVEGADDVGAHRGLLVVLAPVDVGPSRAAGAVKDVRRLHPFQLPDHGLAVLHPHRRREHLLALALQDALQMPGHPALAAPDEEAVGLCGAVGAVCRCHGCRKVGDGGTELRATVAKGLPSLTANFSLCG